MSLKAFHIVFITAAVLLSFGVGGLELSRFQQTREAMDLWFGVGGCAGGVALIAYGVYFLKKLKNISYL